MLANHNIVKFKHENAIYTLKITNDSSKAVVADPQNSKQQRGCYSEVTRCIATQQPCD